MTDPISNCIFCKIIAGQIPAIKVYEDDKLLAFMDIGPLTDGHTLVIPKEHYTKIHDCPADVLARLGEKAGKIAGAVASAMNADGYNLLCNNGRVAGQLVEHVHFHIIPRMKGDGVFTQWPAKKYPEGRIEKLAEKIKQKIKHGI